MKNILCGNSCGIVSRRQIIRIVSRRRFIVVPTTYAFMENWRKLSFMCHQILSVLLKTSISFYIRKFPTPEKNCTVLQEPLLFTQSYKSLCCSHSLTRAFAVPTDLQEPLLFAVLQEPLLFIQSYKSLCCSHSHKSLFFWHTIYG